MGVDWFKEQQKKNWLGERAIPESWAASNLQANLGSSPVSSLGVVPDVGVGLESESKTVDLFGK